MNKFEKKSSVLATRCQLAGGLQGNKFKHVASLGHTVLRARGQGWEVLYRGRDQEPRPGCPTNREGPWLGSSIQSRAGMGSSGEGPCMVRFNASWVLVT